MRPSNGESTELYDDVCGRFIPLTPTIFKRGRLPVAGTAAARLRLPPILLGANLVCGQPAWIGGPQERPFGLGFPTTHPIEYER